MSSKIIQGLTEAYNSIYSQQVVTENIKQIFNSFIEEGHDISDITENDVYEFCVNEGIDLTEAGKLPIKIDFGQLAKALERARGAATGPQARQAATGLLKTGQRAFQQTTGPIASGISRRVQSATQTGQDAARQISQAAAQGPQGPLGQVGRGLKKAAELATGMAPGSGSRLRRSLVVGGTGGLLGSTGLGQAAFDAAGRFIKGGAAAVMNGDKKAPQTQPAQPTPEDKKKSAWDKLTESNDLFDSVKDYLINEGYASTEEQAIVIMANMGESWKNNIIESITKN